MIEPMPEHDLQRFADWSRRRRESLASRWSRVREALTVQPKTATDIAREIGMPEHLVAVTLSHLRAAGHAAKRDKVTLPDGRRVSTWADARAPQVADLIRLHAGSLACRRWA